MISSPEIPFFLRLCWVFTAAWLFSRWEAGLQMWRLLLWSRPGPGGMWVFPTRTEPALLHWPSTEVRSVTREDCVCSSQGALTVLPVLKCGFDEV